MLFDANLSKNFLVEVVVTVVCVINRSPSTVLELKTPKERWSGHFPRLDHLKAFGYVAYGHINQKKLE